MKLRDGAAAALILAGVVILAACTPSADEATPSGSAKPPASASSSPGPTKEPSTKPTPAPTSTVKAIALPKDCKAILSEQVLAQLKDVPLNDPAFGESGTLKNGTLVCIWGSPQADTTGLTTRIERMPRGKALDMLNALADTEGYSCFTPSGGTRCEKTWQNEKYPVTDGRTLFWRDDVMIDTRYSNLAPKGYTSAIVKAIWG